MKRILLVTDVYNWGGHVRAEYIKKHLSDEFEFDIMDDNEFSQYEIKSNPNYFSKDDIKKYLESMKLHEGSQMDFDGFGKFHLESRLGNDYDLFYFLFHTMLVKKGVKRFLNGNKKAITIVTGNPVIKECFYNKRNGREGINNFLKLANKCQAVGANNLFSLNELKNAYDGQTFYAPRGVDPDVFYPEKEFEERNKFIVAYVGKPVFQKGLPDYIKPACEIAGVDLIINDRNYTNALPPNEMRKFYNQADAYIVASTIDGTPNPALEAASCGKPVIANRIGNMPELIEEGINGFLVDMNVNEYVNKINLLKADRKKCFEMGMNARKTILENWTWEKVTENEREIFRRVL